MPETPQLPGQLQKLVEEWLRKDGASVVARHDGGVTLRHGIEEVGHLHPDGSLHLAFPRALRDALVHAGAVDAHPSMPDSSWVTYRVTGPDQLAGALDLLARAETALHRADDPLRTPSSSSERERAIDRGVEETFPASDPPASGASRTDRT